MDNQKVIIKEPMERNILSNLFTKCGQCSIRRTCLERTKETSKINQLIDKEKTSAEKRYKDKKNNLEWNRKVDKDLAKTTKDLWRTYDNSISTIDCNYEKYDVIEDIKLLQEKYDFSDARVFLIVKQHIKQSILDFRAFKETSKKSLITYKTTEDGDRIPIVNPLLSYKLQSGQFMIRLIEILDKITKEDTLIDDMKTSGSDFFKKYLEKIPHTTVMTDAIVKIKK